MGNANTTDTKPPKTSPSIDSRDFVKLLSQHFGHGLVYLADEDDRLLFKTAVDYGLISLDGYVTVAGYRLLRRTAPD